MIPNSTLEIGTNVEQLSPASTGVVAILLPTERGPLLTPTYIATAEQYKRIFGNSLGTGTASEDALKALSKGAKLMISRIVPLHSASDPATTKWTAQKFVVDDVVVASNAPTTLVLTSSMLDALLASLAASSVNKDLFVVIRASGFTGSYASYNGDHRTVFKYFTGTTKAHLITDLGNGTKPSYVTTITTVANTSVTYTLDATIRQALYEQPNAKVEILAAGAWVYIPNVVAARPVMASERRGFVIEPKSVDALDVPYYWGVRPATDGSSNKVDIFMGDSRYPAYEEVVRNVPANYNPAVLQDITDNNSYLKFHAVTPGGDFSAALFTLLPKRLLSYDADNYGTYTAGTYTGGYTDGDYIGDALAKTGLHSFDTTSVPDLYTVFRYISAPVDSKYISYVGSRGSVNGEPGFTAMTVLHQGAPNASLSGAVQFYQAQPASPLKIPMGLGQIKEVDNRMVTTDMLPEFVAAWSKQAAALPPNYLPAGVDYNGELPEAKALTFDIMSPAYKPEADYAYSIGLNMPKMENGKAYIWGIRTAAGSGPFLQGSVVRTLMYLKRNMLQEAGSGLFGPNDMSSNAVKTRRKKLIAILESAKTLGAIQSYTFTDNIGETPAGVPIVNQYNYNFTAVPTYSNEQIVGNGQVTAEDNVIAFA